MKKLIRASLLTNIVILVPVCVVLATDVDRIVGVFGGATPARGILLSIYCSILVFSAILLKRSDPKPVAALLWVQILYKVTTPLTVGTLQNPVVISNLFIAALHTTTLIWIFRSIGNPFWSKAVADSSKQL